MNEENVVIERASARCFVCKLPAETLDALHADRFQNGLGFEAIARKHALPDRPLSESGCRRHFHNGHVIPPEDSTISAADAVPEPALAADDADLGSELDGHAVLDASTKASTEMLDALVRDYRAALSRNPREAERLLGVVMKVQTQLQRVLKERDKCRARRQEFRKAIPKIVDRCTDELSRSITPVMRENAAGIRNDIVEYAHGRLSPEDLWDRLLRYERAWPMEIGERLRLARREALKAEEEAYVRQQG